MEAKQRVTYEEGISGKTIQASLYMVTHLVIFQVKPDFIRVINCRSGLNEEETEWRKYLERKISTRYL
jgi:hypothetical protein